MTNASKINKVDSINTSSVCKNITSTLYPPLQQLELTHWPNLLLHKNSYIIYMSLDRSGHVAIPYFKGKNPTQQKVQRGTYFNYANVS